MASALSGAAGAATQRRVSPFWTSATDHVTTVHLRNNLVNEDLTVQPIFHLENGTAVPVEPVTLSPCGNASINVNELMVSLGYEDRSGGAEFLYEREHGGALNVETEVLMPARDLAYSVESFAPTGRGTNEKHGVFWVPMRTAKLFFAVYNSSDETITVRPELSFDGTVSHLDEIVLAPKGFGKVKMRAPQAWRLGIEPVGSITIRHDGPAGAVQSTGWVDCAKEGYSAMMAFTDPGLVFGNELYGTQIFIGRHPSLRSLGRAGDVESHLVLKNMSSVALAADAEIFYDERGRVGVSPVALGTIDPGEVVSVSFDQLQADGLLPRSISDASVVVRHRGQEGALMGRVFGMSSDKKFGFYTKLETFVGGGYDAVHWTTAGDRDSVITIANFGETNDDVTVTLAYSGGTFDLPTFSLEPRASQTINVRNYAPALPQGVVEGGYAVHGKDRRTSKLLTKQHVISTSEQVALPFYGTPVYAVSLIMNSTSSVTLNVGETDSIWLSIIWSDWTQDPCAWCDASSSNSNIATVTGGGSERTITGVDVGNATVQASSWEIINENGDQDYITSLPQKAVAVVCAIPTNFHQTSATPNNTTGTLTFHYAWGSSTGNLADLSSCQVGEYVSYPGSNPYLFPSPFPTVSNPNPTVNNASGSSGTQGLGDTHSTPGTFTVPYFASSFTATQIYRFSCPCHNAGNWVTLLGPHGITRSVIKNSGTTWRFEITKTGTTASINPLP